MKVTSWSMVGTAAVIMASIMGGAAQERPTSPMPMMPGGTMPMMRGMQ